MTPVILFDEIDSTSREAARRAEAGERGPLWLRAAVQTAGRGRSGRGWVSPAGNLHATLLVPLDCEPQQAALHSFAASLALAETLDGFVADGLARIALKWPNDVLLDGRKVAGILLETGGAGERRWLSIGIGLNIAHVPQDVRWPAISLAEALGDAAPAADALFAVLAQCVEVEIDRLNRDGFDRVRRRWLARAARLGARIEARLPRETLIGRFEGVGEDGALLLGTATGTRCIAAADIHFPTVREEV